jgi:hypothetical protein
MPSPSPRPVYVEAEPEAEPEPQLQQEPAVEQEEPVAEAAQPSSQPVWSPVLEREPVTVAAETTSPGRTVLMALGGIILLQMIVIGWLLMRSPAGPGGIPAGDGELVVESRPPGARVVVDNQERGVTPLTMTLSAGAHVMQVRVGTNEPRVIPLAIRAGVQTSLYVELQGVPTTGTLEIRTEPRGARVFLDGQNRGTTPVTLRDLPPGDHEVMVELNGRQAKQTVKVEAGRSAQLVIPIK